MARKVEVHLIDDLDQSPADETVPFALDGFDYTIDLSGRNAQRLRGALAPYVERATRVSRTARRATVVARPRRERDDRNGRIRSWAAERGLQVAPHGRIKQEVIDQFDEAQRNPPPPAAPAGRRRARRTRRPTVVVTTAE